MYRIEAVIFKATGPTNMRFVPNQWDRLLDGFKRSSENTNAQVVVHELPEHKSRKRVELAANHYKLKYWAEIVRKAKVPTVLCDADICFLDDIECGFTDKAITLTARTKRWCNAGVVFVRPGEEASRFFDRWREMDQWIHEGETDVKGNPLRLKKAWQETGVKGHNQTALALIKDEFEFGWVDGAVYNASLREEWMGVPKVVHVKDSMRRDLLYTKEYRYPICKRMEQYYF